ncbi:alpha/beta hydrolase [Salinisphaera aquimarina]|uniref:Alpha/beta hydrolase n=1 Tax=Salinisphaera aquimarina TaxID=2094031 RepID=A0ABV7EQL8_9GAMM
MDVGDNTSLSRAQDSRTFSVDEDELAFDALPGVTTDRYSGVLDGAGYRVEVPENWNGMLVMYAHGYRGEGPDLTVDSPSLRPYFIANGYAWAASSYSTNYYDVRTGVEDTNNLALNFADITGQMAPSKIYIMGVSMGGHITAAAIEDETAATAVHKVSYSAAMPACGVVGGGDTEFNYLLNFTFAAQKIAGMGPSMFPNTDFDQAAIDAVLWDTLPSFSEQGVPTEQGMQLEDVVRQLSGGNRPVFELGFRGGYYNVVMGTGGRDGKVNGILARDLTDNSDYVYQFDADPAQSTEESAFNGSILRVMGNPGANPPQPDGLRWIPRVNGEFSVPVVSLHGLGDLYVPFSNEQVYRRRAEANGNGDMLVQRAIRSAPHCDFTAAELVSGFQDMIDWEQNGTKPAGDEVLDADTVAAADYGCQFTSETRAGVAACPVD